MTNTFDPNKFIDREFEQELFEDLLKLQDDGRVLAIRDGGGMGKSQLLAHFQYRCRVVSRPRIPVSLVTLGEPSTATPFSLLKTISQQLEAFGLPFSTFKQHLSDLAAGDFTPFRMAVTLSFQQADFKGAKGTHIAGSMVKGARIDTLYLSTQNTPQMTPEQEKMSQGMCIDAFFKDLQSCCAEQPVVLLFDAYEKTDPELRRWMADHLLEHHFFDCQNRPAQLILVVAGREVPDFRLRWAPDKCKSVVKSVDQLGKWRREHVETCLRVHGFRYELQDVDAFHRLIERGIPPSQVVQLMIQIAVAGGQVQP